MALKEASFTFSVPKQPVASTSTVKSPSFAPDNSLFSTLPRITYTAPDPSNYTNPLDMTSMMSFDPSVLNLLDESPQETATDGAMQMDFGFGNNNDEFLPKNYTTIANNPAFLSLASAFDHFSPPINTSSQSQSPSSSSSDRSPFNFDLNSLTQWPTPSTTSHDSGTLDDLFGGGGFLNPPQSMDVSTFMTSGSPSVSPIIHHTNHGSPATSASSSPASHTSDPLFSGREGSSSESETGHDDSECPKTKADFHKHIESAGPSAFVDPATNNNFLHTMSCSPFPSSTTEKPPSFLSSVECDKRTTFPSVEKSENNVPVLDAWRSITRDPQYKECDIANLCSEFASKARCDGSKVVLEPSGVSSLMETLASKKRLA
jgi:AP-1-like factor